MKELEKKIEEMKKMKAQKERELKTKLKSD